MAIDLVGGQKESSRKVFRLSLSLHPKQREVDASPARFKIVRAGRKFGKTTYAQKKALDWLGKPNSTVWMISPTYKQAKLISWADFKRLIPMEALGKKPNDTDLVITLKNGSQLYLMGSDDPDSLRGPAPTGCIFEEAAFHSREAWYEVVRPNLMPKKAPALFIGTPKGFNWFHDLESEALRLKSAGSKEWDVFHFSVYDNPYIDKDEIADAKKSCDSEAVWRQEYMAEYESSVGRVFAAFDGTINGRHVKRVQVPSGRFEAYRAIDWGMRDDCACVWGYIKRGVLFVYREYLANNLSAPSQGKIIRDQTPSKETIAKSVISHDAAKEDPTMKGLTVMWHFRQAGINPLIPSSRDKKHSRAMITQLISQDRLVIDSENCPKLRKQLLSYEWKDTAMEKPNDLGNDDAVDALHYLVEMLQFDLFLDRKRDDVITQDQMYAEIARERMESWKHPTTIVPMGHDLSNPFGAGCDDTPAGYPL